LVKIVGKKDSPGRPFLYGTTRDFLQYFGLKNLTELPQINPILSDEAA
jgi:segregation and condensation protein B